MRPRTSKKRHMLHYWKHVPAERKIRIGRKIPTNPIRKKEFNKWVFKNLFY